VASGQARPGLKIVVIEGEGAVNNILFGSAREPIVQVRDENDKPVTGAKVTFTLPDRGPGGTFFGTGKNLSVTTNDQGRATGTGFRHNFIEGHFQIQVTATKGNISDTVNISQNNVLPQTSVPSSDDTNRVVKSEKKFGRGKIIAVVGAAAIIAAVAATRGHDSTTTTTPGTSVTPGTISVGSPR